ncbi:MAG: tetratricopeptide repeat protein [Candidatus Tumulicola sp.]
MFRFWARFASARAPSPHDQPLAALEDRDFNRAEQELTALLTRATAPLERAFLLNKRGVARVAMQQTELAREDFTAATECAGGFAPALTNLANLLLEEGEIGAAIARYERAILADPNYALAHFNLGAAYKRAGRFADAVRALRRAQRLEKPTFSVRRRPP